MKKVKSLDKWKNKAVGLLTNQSAFGFKNDYHYQYYRNELDLKVLFLPEHGLFAELQDQVSGKDLNYSIGNTEIVNLYGDEEQTLVPPKEHLRKLDLVIIDIRDVGSRYYTFLTTANYILHAISELNQSEGTKIEALVVDSPNPIGDKVEGTPLHSTYSSFVGVPTVLHRHGLSPATLLAFYKEEFSYKLSLYYLPIGVIYPKKSKHWIPPSPNIPFSSTCLVYPGQCLLEGTNLSEGRGTTRPFETFGAPYLLGSAKAELERRMKTHQKNCYTLRPLRFLPTFHKHQGIICEGYQILVDDPDKFHSLYFTLFLLKQLKDLFPNEFAYLKGVYEFRSNLSAIELLVGDPILLEYLHGKSSDKDIEDYLKTQEKTWLKRTAETRKRF